jgi:hypothetical protein
VDPYSRIEQKAVRVSKTDDVPPMRKRIRVRNKGGQKTSVDVANDIINMIDGGEESDLDKTISEEGEMSNSREISSSETPEETKERIRRKYSPMKYILSAKKRPTDSFVLTRGKVSKRVFNKSLDFIDNLGRKKKQIIDDNSESQEEDDNEEDEEEHEEEEENESEEDEESENSYSSGNKILGKKTKRT